MASRKHEQCECYDAHDGHSKTPGGSRCSNVERLRLIYRVDMEDRTGTAMCLVCRGNAMDSGLFSEEVNSYS